MVPLGVNPLQPIRCCLAKAGRLWVGYWNKVHVVSTDTKKVEVRSGRDEMLRVFVSILPLLLNFPCLGSQQVFSVSERSEQQVRFLCAAGSGVWISCRLDPILRLFDWSTGRPLQEVDFSALVTKALGTLIPILVTSLPYSD